jgi:hypothetical protein
MEFKVEAESVVVALGQAPVRITRALAKGLTRVGAGLERHIKAEELSGQRLDVRTGTGRRSVFHRLELGTDEVTVVAGADLEKARYMRAQERGADLRPRRGRYLTLPLKAVRTGNGVARFTARQVIESPQAFGYTGTFFHGRVLFGRKAAGERPVPLFALVSGVRLKPVGFLTSALREKGDWARDQVAAIAGEGVDG